MTVMTYEFDDLKPTTDQRLRIALGIAGGSGTGKTYSAMLAARGLAAGKPFAVIDTENKRALHYKADFPEMEHFNMGAEINGEMVGFPPERWIAAIRQLQGDYPVIVIDSFSHAWEGINGVLEMQTEELQRLVTEAEQKANGRYEVNPDRFNQLSWVTVKQRYRRLIEAIIQADSHVVICMRAKPVMQAYDRSAKAQKNTRSTKLRRDDLPWDIASDRDLIFEMTASMLMVPEAPGQPVLLKCPDHFRGMFASQSRMSSNIGNAMREWADEGGVDQAAKKLLDRAQDAARGGKDSLQALYKSCSQSEKAIINTNIDQLKAIAIKADEAKGDDIFGDDDDARPSEEEMARAEREAREAAEKAAAGAAAEIERGGQTARQPAPAGIA